MSMKQYRIYDEENQLIKFLRSNGHNMFRFHAQLISQAQNVYSIGLKEKIEELEEVNRLFNEYTNKNPDKNTEEEMMVIFKKYLNFARETMFVEITEEDLRNPENWKLITRYLEEVLHDEMHMMSFYLELSKLISDAYLYSDNQE